MFIERKPDRLGRRPDIVVEEPSEELVDEVLAAWGHNRTLRVGPYGDRTEILGTDIARVIVDE